MQHSWLIVGFVVVAACSSDNGPVDPSTGSGATGAIANSGGVSAGGGGSGGMVNVAAGGGGTTGSGGATVGDAGDKVDAGSDAGHDAGAPFVATKCKAPVAAASAGNACSNDDPVALKATLVKAGLSTPVLVTHAPGDSERLFVVERSGRISILNAATGADVGDFLNVQNVATSTSASDERGLLGLAFHPDYPTDPRFFVNFTTTPPVGSLKTVIASYVVSSDPNLADPTSEQVLMDYNQPQSNHNGGMLAFGTDGCLFSGSGDGGNMNDTGSGHAAGGNGQSLATPLGKILRIDVDAPMTAAPGNLAGTSVPQIWDYGMRNPWRFSFDRKTGDLYIGDVGQGTWEEVDVEAAGVGNKNYGWPYAEGNACGPAGGCNAGMLAALEPAVDAYDNGSNGDNCVIGGYVYRGAKIPSLNGWYLFADNGSNRIRAFVWDGTGRCNDKTLLLSQRDSITVNGKITSFGEGDDGELYIATGSSVYRIEAK